MSNRVDDCQRCKQPRNDRNRNGSTDSNNCHQAKSQERATNSPQVIHGSLKPVGPAICTRWDDIGKQRISSWNPKATRCPGSDAKERDLPDCRTQTDERSEDSGRRVAPNRDRAPATWIIGDCPTAKASDPCSAIRQTLDQT
jgi:hypothetical protein